MVLLVAVALWVTGPPDAADWITSYLDDWAIMTPLAILAPVVVALTVRTIKDTGKSADRVGFSDPLAYLRILIWLYQMLTHPWQWATSGLKNLAEPPNRERHKFRLALTEWVIYTAEGKTLEGRPIVGWELARYPVTGSQQYTTSVAHGFMDADDDFKLVLDLAIRQAHKAAYTSFGVWGIVIFLLSRIGGVYAVVVGVLWILAVSAILHWWYIGCLTRQQGPVLTPGQDASDASSS